MVQGLVQWIVLLGYDEEVEAGSEIDSLIRDDAFTVERNEAAIARFEQGAGVGVVHTTFPILWDGEGFIEPDEFWSEFFNNHPFLFKGAELAISRLMIAGSLSQETQVLSSPGSDDSRSPEQVPSLADRCQIVTMVAADQAVDVERLADTLIQLRDRLGREVKVEAILGLLIPDDGF